ncbi:hypothetical protein OF83DRAFT_1083712 [Amylostereum chailletii]|nr:hypothetical protein OF83DRAFT_1083712 [Amylostereum chailletii]
MAIVRLKAGNNNVSRMTPNWGHRALEPPAKTLLSGESESAQQRQYESTLKYCVVLQVVAGFKLSSGLQPNENRFSNRLQYTRPHVVLRLPAKNVCWSQLDETTSKERGKAAVAAADGLGLLFAARCPPLDSSSQPWFNLNIPNRAPAFNVQLGDSPRYPQTTLTRQSSWSSPVLAQLGEMLLRSETSRSSPAHGPPSPSHSLLSPLDLCFVSSRLDQELDLGSPRWNQSLADMLDNPHSPPISVQPLRSSPSIVSRPPTPMREDPQVEELRQTVPKSRIVQSKCMSADKRCLSALDGFCRTRRRGGCEEFLTLFSAKASKGVR